MFVLVIASTYNSSYYNIVIINANNVVTNTLFVLIYFTRSRQINVNVTYSGRPATHCCRFVGAITTDET